MPTPSRTQTIDATIIDKVVCPRSRAYQTTRSPLTSIFAPPTALMCPSTAEPRQLSAGDFDVWVDVEVAAEYFSCRNCHCVLDSYELVVAAELPETIAAQGDPSDFNDPDEYGND